MLVRQFSRFLIVGTLGFLVEAAILFTFNTLLGFSPLTSRLPSFGIAVIVTWCLNRAYTFEARNLGVRQTFPAYLSCNMIGLGINLAVYTLAVIRIPFFHDYPVAALAAGSVSGLLFNFSASKFWVFKKGRNT